MLSTLLLLVALGAGNAAGASQLTPRDEDRWRVTLKPYVWASALHADVGIGSLPPTEVDLDFADIVEDLDFAFMLGAELRKGESDWALVFDSLYLRLEKENANLDATVEQYMIETDFAYRESDDKAIELIVGARYWNTDIDLDLGGGGSGSRSRDWIDPVLGARGIVELSDKWSLRLRGDIGGFGVGSDFTYQIAGVASFAVSPSFGVGLGYRHLAVDYDDSGFQYDAEFSGLIVGIEWTP